MYRFAYVLTAVFCAVCAVRAQDAGAPAAAPAKAAPAAPDASAAQDKPVVKNLEIRSGPRGMILIINGSGPIAPLGGKSSDFEKATAKYKEFTVNMAGAGSAFGATATFNPPPELPVKDITLKSVASGLSITIKMRTFVNGPIDVKNSNNQVRILLTRDALPEYVWSSEKGVVSAPPPSPPPSAKPQTAASGPAPASGPAASAKVAAAAPPQKQAPGAPNVASKTETPAALPPVLDASHSGEVTKKTHEGELVKYKVFGRDPFVPLIRDTTTTALPSVENLKLVGVLEDARERIALVEDFKNGNRAFALRTNDPVAQGKVLRVHRDKVVFLIRDFEVSHSYTLGLSNTDK
ncbi:MAG: hypothetical protein LBC59_06255 [Chitinispirillales bacterium]|nr:hypothetical protein [Chitinispirillales bacterium]